MSMPLEWNVTVAAMETDDWSAVRAIYLQGVATGNATFEKSAPTWKQWDSGHLTACRLVARSQGEVLGWAALSPSLRTLHLCQGRGGERLRCGRDAG
jgi:phosphinothricin acetyltransferase